MYRQKIYDEIDRLTGTAILNEYKPEWVKFTFLKGLKPCERLTLEEWLYLASKSNYGKLWAHSEYNRQESIAWHHRKLESIEIELKKNGI